MVTPEYSYAIYNNRQLIAQHGVFNYEFKFRWLINPLMESQFITQNASTHLVYAPRSNILIVVSKNNNSIFSLISPFFL
jgi:hypothetical protein